MDHKLPDTALAGYVSGEVSAVFAQLFDTIYGQRADDAAPAQPAGKLGSTLDSVEDTKHGSPGQTSLAESPTGVPNRVSAGMLLRTGARLDAQAREIRKLKSELHRLVTPQSDADVKSTVAELTAVQQQLVEAKVRLVCSNIVMSFGALLVQFGDVVTKF